MTTGKLIVTLRSGAQVTADVNADEVEWARTEMTGKLTRLAWKTPEGATDQLCFIDINEVAAFTMSIEAPVEAIQGR